MLCIAMTFNDKASSISEQEIGGISSIPEQSEVDRVTRLNKSLHTATFKRSNESSELTKIYQNIMKQFKPKISSMKNVFKVLKS